MVNDVGGVEMCPVDIWLKEEWMHVVLPDVPVQVAIEDEIECLTAVRTRGFDFDGKLLVT